MLSPSWMTDPMNGNRLTKLAKRGRNGTQIRKTFGIRSMASLAFRMIRGCEKKKGKKIIEPRPTHCPEGKKKRNFFVLEIYLGRKCQI